MDIELYGLINSKLKGKASLVNGKVPADQLPSYVDDVINGYYHDDKFYEENTYTTEIPAEEGKIYVDLATNITYRWSGLAYIQIGGGSVEANPTLVGDEPYLAGLQIGDAKYVVNDKFYVVYEGNIPNDMPSASKGKLKEINCLGFILKTSYGNRYYKKYSESSNEITFLQLTGTTAPLWCYATMNKNSNSITTSTTVLGLPSDVVANPTLAGTENNLISLQVGETKYKIPSGAYVAIANASNYITSDEFAYIDANYKTVPCYISHPDFGLYEVNHKQGTTLYSTLTSSTGFSNGNDGELKQLQVSSDDNYKVRATALPVKKVFANPTLSGGEPSLTSLQVAGVRYKVEQPINVEANPTLAGTEAELTGLQIGNTKYKVPSGGELYMHRIGLTTSSNGAFYLTVYLNISTPIDTKQLFKDTFFTGVSDYGASPYLPTHFIGEIYPCARSVYKNGNDIFVQYKETYDATTWKNANVTGFNDSVSQIL